VKYVAAITRTTLILNQTTDVFAAKEHHMLNPLLCRLLCVPAASAPVERFLLFSQGGRPHYEANLPSRARMGDALLETLIHLRCSGN